MDKIEAMRAGGLIVREIKKKLIEFTKVGTTFMEVENETQRLIAEANAQPNFSLVPGYHWAICINRNEGIVHGIPNDTVVADGDLISIDTGVLWQNWNLDTSISFIVGQTTPEKEAFMSAGKKALHRAINQAVAGNSIYDISREIEKTIIRAGYDPSYQLAGHYIGRDLHMSPLIPCVAAKKDRKKMIEVGDTMAIEVMYAQRQCDLELASDGWTYQTIDKSLTALFEETILITDGLPEILT